MPGSLQDHVSPASTSPQDQSQTTDKLVLEYLKSRGYKAVEKALLDTLEVDRTNGASRTGDNVLKEALNVSKELASMGSPSSIQNLVASIAPVVTDELLSLDPIDRQEGYRELESWVDGSLDIYRPEFRLILFPIFSHFYLDLVQQGFREAAAMFFSAFSPSLLPAHSIVIHHLSTLLLPSHVLNDELAQQFRKEKYVIKMSRSGFGLLIGWLVEGIGGESYGTTQGFSGEQGKRGRAAVLRVLNNHLLFDVVTTTVSTLLNIQQPSSGLLSSLIPRTSTTSAAITNPQTFNASQSELKLGPIPVTGDVRLEVDRILKEQAVMERDRGEFNWHYPVPPTSQGSGEVSESDLLPRQPSFSMADVQKEVNKIRDARKRIRLDSKVLNYSEAGASVNGANKARSLPSICAYTFHDTGDGIGTCSFSLDGSFVAAASSESHIRLWNLKGTTRRDMSSTRRNGSVQDSSMRQGGDTVKLIGHSGPVYGLSFDPVDGSAGPSKLLLSASADSTVRLWSLQSFVNLAVYRGHQNPVWDVQWSPSGTYFATASRDRTARLWSSDRMSCLRMYAGHLGDVDCARFHTNSLYLATGSSDWTARLWDVQSGSCVRVFVGHQAPLTTLALSEDGRYMATAGEDHAIILWDLGSGRQIKKLTGHTSSIHALAFSSDSAMLVSGSSDWTVRCWDVTVGADFNQTEAMNVDTPEQRTSPDLLAIFPTKRTSIAHVCFTPRNLCIAAGNYVPL